MHYHLVKKYGCETNSAFIAQECLDAQGHIDFDIMISKVITAQREGMDEVHKCKLETMELDHKTILKFQEIAFETENINLDLELFELSFYKRLRYLFSPSSILVEITKIRNTYRDD